MLAKIAAVALLASGLVSAPAMANETAIGAVGSAQVVTPAGPGDSEFSELFSSWENLEAGGSITRDGSVLAAPRAAVSVPSRMPLETVRLTSDFGMRTHPVLGGRRQHNGIDLAAPTGTPVYATADGLVGMAQYFGSYGNYVQIEHGGDMQTRYAHLSSFTVTPGTFVSKGDLIGYVGSTGRSTGPHLHYEVRIAGQAVDPRPYMFAELTLDEDRTAAGGPE